MINSLNSRIQSCCRALRRGECIAYPTEAVWGLGCDPHNRHAVATILRMKQRPIYKGLILAAGHIDDFAFLIDRLAPDMRAKVASSWPGHVTWLVPHHNLVPGFISGNSDKVAVRVSAHPVVGALSKAFGGPIVSTSANPAGRPSALNQLEVRRYFRNEALVCASGRVGVEKRASRIIDAETGKVLRA